MQSLDYLYAQMRLEGKGLTPPDRLTRLPTADDDVPLVLVAQLADAAIKVFFGELLTAEIRAQLILHAQALQFPLVTPIRQVLHSHGIRTHLGHFRTYLFPTRVSTTDAPVQRYDADDPKIRAFDFAGFGTPIFAIEQTGEILSACVSVRENEQCGEAWVYTAPDYRHQGLARNVVTAWAQSLIVIGKIPFYSHKIDNRASAGLAHRLGLVPIFEEISLAREA
jgi:hypothetical protein